MRNVGGWVVLAGLVAACSGSTKQNGAHGTCDDNGATAGTGGSAGTAGDSGDTAGTSGSGGDAGAPMSSGDAGAAGEPMLQGQPGAHHPDCGADCGGSPVGAWVYTGKTSCNLIPESTHPPEPEACSIVLLPNSTEGEPPVRIETGPRFDFSGQLLDFAVLRLAADGQYLFVTMYRGTGHMYLAPECRQLGETVALCSDVAAAVEPSLIGEGSGQGFTCVDSADGGCDCSYEVHLVGGPTGVWRTTADGKLLLRPSFPNPDDPAPEPITYCAGETLALGPELRIPSQPTTGEPMVFERVDCTDGLRGPGEDGVDCGIACEPCAL